MFERIFRDGGGGEGRETKPLPQPLPEEGGEWLVVEMEEVVLGLIRGVMVLRIKGKMIWGKSSRNMPYFIA